MPPGSWAARNRRGYRLPGYGLVFVLTPRALSSGEKGAFVFRVDGPRHRVVRVETRRAAEAAAPDQEEQEIETLAMVEAIGRYRESFLKNRAIAHRVRSRKGPPRRPTDT